MKVSYSNHTPPRPGQGILVVSAWEPARPEVRRLEFMLKRASDQKNLGASGWREEERFFPPLRAAEQDGNLLLHIGPEVVDHLDLRETYAFYLNWPGLEQPLRAVLRVSDLLYSPLNEAGSIKSSDPAAPPAPPEVFTPPPQPQAKAADIFPPPVGPAEPSKPTEPLKPVEPPRLGQPLLTGPEGKPRRPLFLIAAGVIAFIVVVGSGVHDFLSSEPEEQIPPLQQARQHLAQEKPDPNASLQLALKLRQQDSAEAHDAAFLLLEDAADKNSGQAMLLLGEYYDPLNTSPNGSIFKDSAQALAWYGRAKAEGRPEAERKIEVLSKWTEENHEN
jgi:hypothetical protein